MLYVPTNNEFVTFSLQQQQQQQTKVLSIAIDFNAMAFANEFFITIWKHFLANQIDKLNYLQILWLFNHIFVVVASIASGLTSFEERDRYNNNKKQANKKKTKFLETWNITTTKRAGKTTITTKTRQINHFCVFHANRNVYRPGSIV